jgi:hypothetical protein
MGTDSLAAKRRKRNKRFLIANETPIESLKGWQKMAQGNALGKLSHVFDSPASRR